MKLFVLGLVTAVALLVIAGLAAREIGQPINSAKGSETADGVAREANA